MNFANLDTILQRWIDTDFLPGASYAILRGAEIVHMQCFGLACKEDGTPIREDTIFRIFSNTKLPASLAVLLLMEEGRIGLDDPVGEYLPKFADARVLRPGARTLDDTVPAHAPMTVRHLLTHTSGLTYPFVDPQHILGKAYNETGVYSRTATLAEAMDRLAALPLLFQPGTAWNYSMATDVVGRIIEVVSGVPLGVFLRERIFDPLEMADTGFHVPEAKRARFAAMYSGDLQDPTRPGLKRVDHALPYPGAYLSPPARESAGGGLVSTLADYARLLRALMPGGPALLKPENVALLKTNQLPDGMVAGLPPTPGMGHGLASGLWVRPVANDPPTAEGELFWGGIAGTKWLIAPKLDLAVALMTQRWMGYNDPYWVEFRRAVYALQES